MQHRKFPDDARKRLHTLHCVVPRRIKSNVTSVPVHLVQRGFEERLHFSDCCRSAREQTGRQYDAHERGAWPTHRSAGAYRIAVQKLRHALYGILDHLSWHCHMAHLPLHYTW